MKNEQVPSLEIDRVPQPAVIFVGGFGGAEDSLVGVLSEDYNIKPLYLPSVFEESEEDTARLSTLIKAGFVSCLIVEHRYDKEMLTQELAKIRVLAGNCPVYIQSFPGADRLDPAYLRKHDVVDLTGAQSFRLLIDTLKSWKPPINYFGVRDVDELAQTVSLLTGIGSEVHENSDRSIPIDPNTALVTQALRMGMNPVETRYDDMQHYGKPDSQKPPISESEADKELVTEIERFRLLKDEERRDVVRAIYRRLGWEVIDGGGIKVLSPSRGQENSGFAFNLYTGVFSTSSGYGAHREALQNVISRIREKAWYREMMSGVVSYRNSDSRDIEESCHYGVLVRGITGFGSPFAVIWGEREDPDVRRRVADFVMTHYRAIPVDPFVRLFE